METATFYFYDEEHRVVGRKKIKYETVEEAWQKADKIAYDNGYADFNWVKD